MPAAPSWASALRTRSGSFGPGGHDDLGAGDLQRVRRPARGAARETTTVSGTSAAPRTSWESSGSRASESNTIRRGWRETPSMRAVSCGSSASAVPIPTATASHSARQWCDSRRESSPEIHFESPVRVATLPSSVIADLNSTHGRPVRACLRNGWLSSRARAASSPSANVDLDALVAQDPRAAAGGLLRRVVGGDRRRGRCRPRGSRPCTAACARCGSTAPARRTASRPRRSAPPQARDRRALGVRRRRARRGSPPPATLPSLHDHGADERVRARPAPPALGELDRAGEVRVVGLEKGGHGADRIIDGVSRDRDFGPVAGCAPHGVQSRRR